jgi:hypothetical protein
MHNTFTHPPHLNGLFFIAGNPEFKSMPETQDTQLVVSKLEPGTLYQFVVYASNEYKRGALSKSVQEYTANRKTPALATPRDVKVTAISSMALKVSWKPPLNA